MRKTALAAIFALSASTSFAQTDVTAQKPGNAGPANLCAELVAFMKACPPEPAPPPKSVEREQKGGSEHDASGQNDPAHATPDPHSARQSAIASQQSHQTSGPRAPDPAEPASTS